MRILLLLSVQNGHVDGTRWMRGFRVRISAFYVISEFGCCGWFMI